jgi:DNA-binding NtrC family response regulator
MRQDYISREKILVVDDERAVRDVLQERINNFGYDCKTANNGLEASQKIQGNQFDVIITDIKMPEMEGIELLRKIIKEHPGIDFLVMTGYGAEYTFTQVIEEGATDFIIKPFKSDELKAKLHRIMRERRLKELDRAFQ